MKKQNIYSSHKKSRLNGDTFHVFEGSFIKSYETLPGGKPTFKHAQPICAHTRITSIFVANSTPGQDKGECVVTTEATEPHQKEKSKLYFIEKGIIDFIREIKKHQGQHAPNSIDEGFHLTI